MSSVLIITDNKRNIDYSILKSFYTIVYFKKNDSIDDLTPKNKLVLIDLDSVSETNETVELVRKNHLEKSILIIQNFDEIKSINILKNATGYGQISTFDYRQEYPELLLESVNKLMHPQYPVGASDIAIILPVYNEESRFNNVIDFYKKLTVLCTESFLNSTIYFVNDGSVDRTDELIEQIVDKVKADTDTISNVAFANAHQLGLNTRKAGAYIDGIKSIRADILIFVDADNSFRIEDIAKLINIMREGYYELVVGTKDLTAENRPLIRKMMSFAKRMLTKSLLPKGVYDSQTGLKAMNGVSAKYILPHLNVSTGLAIDLEILNIAKKYGFRTLQIPVQCIDQEGSHINLVKDSVNFIKNIVKIRNRNKKIDISKLK